MIIAYKSITLFYIAYIQNIKAPESRKDFLLSYRVSMRSINDPNCDNICNFKIFQEMILHLDVASNDKAKIEPNLIY